VIALASAADLADLAGMMADSALLQRYRVTSASALRPLSSALEAGDLLLVSREQAAILGFAWLSFASRVLNGAAYLRLLLVASSARSAGTGSALLEAAEVRSRERANHLYLLVTTDNTAARRFYARHGYRHVGDLPGLVWPDLDEALYHKPLRPHSDRLA
jgi:GNAT superfamily N-acetyltransferase